MKTLKYDLKHKFEIAVSGEKVEANYLEIMAPNNMVIRHVSVLDKEMNKAIFNFSKNHSADQVQEQDADKSEISGKEMMMALNAGGGDLEKCYTAFRAIMIMACKVDGETKFTSTMYDKMNYSDTKCLLGEYLGFFLAISLDS